MHVVCVQYLGTCPIDEPHVGNLQVKRQKEVVKCYKWKEVCGEPEDEIGYQLCETLKNPNSDEPSEFMKTKYSQLLRFFCRTNLTQNGDRAPGIGHSCPKDTSFMVKVC